MNKREGEGRRRGRSVSLLVEIVSGSLDGLEWCIYGQLHGTISIVACRSTFSLQLHVEPRRETGANDRKTDRTFEFALFETSV